MRIRSVKPSFMRHEELQDLEVANPGAYIMLVFQGLWMLSDSKGKFEYKPKHMKLEILPFIDYSLQKTLDILENAGYFVTYEVNGKKYGIIPTFLDHQRINGKEKADGEKYPDPIGLKADSAQGNNGEAPENLEGTQEEEREREEELGKGTDNARTSPIDPVEETLLTKKILQDFGFNEVSNHDKLRIIATAIREIISSGKLEYFSQQYRDYMIYKDLANEKKHNLPAFFGDPPGWDSANWSLKIQTHAPPGKPGKILNNINKAQAITNPFR